MNIIFFPNKNNLAWCMLLLNSILCACFLQAVQSCRLYEYTLIFVVRFALIRIITLKSLMFELIGFSLNDLKIRLQAAPRNIRHFRNRVISLQLRKKCVVLLFEEFL